MFFIPSGSEGLPPVIDAAKRDGVELFFLGDGANILVADEGIRGLVIDMSGLDAIRVEGTLLMAEAGAPVSRACEVAAEHNLSGMEFLYSMPGSVGGSVWMNARCYGTSIAEILEYVDIIDASVNTRREYPDREQFDYKYSPFQHNGALILRCGFRLQQAEKIDTVYKRMQEHERDRNSKGHFDLPSAGSVFKNNRSFGQPTGKLIDNLGLRGYTIGGAKISEAHANIIVNTGTATAREILALIRYVEKQVKQEYGFELERELLLVGEW